MPISILFGVAVGVIGWFLVRYLVAGVYTVNQNERAVKTSFGRAERVGIRKVHFRDTNMIKQIEEKVVNRLRQVTSAIKQDGANQVSIITSTAERQAAIEFGKAAAMRPRILGAGLQEIARDPDISRAMFDILEAQKMLDGEAEITLIPKGSDTLKQLSAAGLEGKQAVAPVKS
jgi:hypothetical protein